jgi:hypothetical protein
MRTPSDAVQKWMSWRRSGPSLSGFAAACAGAASERSLTSPDQGLLGPAVADRLARGIDAAGQRRFRHDTAAPHLPEQVVLADDAVPVADQAHQDVEDLGLERDELPAALEFAAVRVEQVRAKAIKHARVPWRAGRGRPVIG